MHWKAEQTVLNYNVYEKYANTSKYRNFGVDFKQLHRATYSNDSTHQPSPPPYTLYTGLNLAQGFWVFLLLQVVNSVAIILLKMKLSGPFQEAMWSSKARHIAHWLDRVIRVLLFGKLTFFKLIIFGNNIKKKI